MTSTSTASCAHLHDGPLYGGLLRQCADCGLTRTASAADVTYERDYFVGDAGGGYDFDSSFAVALDRARFDAELERLEQLGLRGSVLDVGCATGRFLVLARARGWEIAGVEVAEFARRIASEVTDAPIAASLDEIDAARTFDVVTLHHVLEHLEDPGAFLRDQVRARVKHHLLIEVPNFASLASRTHGPRWRDLRPEQHRHHFTPASLSSLVSTAGFEILTVTTRAEALWSLRTAVETVHLLPTLVRQPHYEDTAMIGVPHGVDDVRGYTPPSGFRRLASETSRLAFLPLVRGLERAGLAERLVLEARPREDTTA